MSTTPAPASTVISAASGARRERLPPPMANSEPVARGVAGDDGVAGGPLGAGGVDAGGGCVAAPGASSGGYQFPSEACHHPGPWGVVLIASSLSSTGVGGVGGVAGTLRR